MSVCLAPRLEELVRVPSSGEEGKWNPLNEALGQAGHLRAMPTGTPHMFSLLLLILCLSSAINIFPYQKLEYSGREDS